MTRFLTFALLFISCYVQAQSDFITALEKEFTTRLDIASYPLLTMDWNFNGKVQGSVNAGMTELIDNKNYSQAIVYFNEAIRELPTVAPAYYYRGVCYKLLNKIPEARKDLIRASELAPSSSAILSELGEVYELEGQYTAAIKLYHKAVRKDPSFATAYYNLGNVSLTINLPRDAKKYFEKCVTADPHFAKAYTNLGIVSFTVERNDVMATSFFNQALTADSTCQSALFWRGMMFANKKKVPESLRDWNSLISYNPENPLLVLVRALLYLQIEQYDKAFTDLKKIISKHYEDENQFRGQRSILDRQLDLQFAVSYITRTIYGLDDDASSPLKKGFCFLAMGNMIDAVTEFKKSSTIQPTALSFFLTALAFDHNDKPDSAFAYYDKALKLDNDIFDAHKKRGIYLSTQKNWKGANKDFQEMVRLEPGLNITYRLRGKILMQLRDYYGSIIAFTSYLKSDSSDYEIRMDRAFCEKTVEDFKHASIDYRKALSFHPDKYALFEDVVTSDLLVSDTLHALQTIEDCKRVFHIQPTLFSTQVRIYILQNNRDKAKEELRKVIGKHDSDFRPNDYQNSTLYFLDGWIDYLEHHPAKALKKLNKSIQFHDNNQEALYLRSKVLIALGEKAKAMTDLETLVQNNHEDAKLLLAELQK